MTTTAAPAVLGPGVYPDLPEAEYHAHPALSQSKARKLLPPSCPAKFRWEQEHGQPAKNEFDIGKAAHRYALGVGAELRVIEHDNYRTATARAERDEAYADGVTPLLTREHDEVLAMEAALRAHPRAGKLFAPGRGTPEQSLIWEDPRTRVPLRARLDWTVWTGRRLIIVDYKTAASAEPKTWSRDFHRFGYFIQAPWYLAGAVTLGLAGDVEPVFAFVVQEREAPYIVTTFQPDQEALRAGRAQMREAIDLFAECERSGHWPPYSEGIEPVSLPVWAEREYLEGTL